MPKMEAIILAGGFGTRLKSVVRDVPKPMADINGSPFLSYLIDYLSENGVGRVIFATGHLSEAITGFFGDNYGRMAIAYAVEDEPLGTGGAIRESIRLVGSEDFVIMNGDTFFGVDLKELYSAHRSSGAALTLSLKPMSRFERYGNVLIEGDRVRGFSEKKFTEAGYINGGVYCAGKGLKEALRGCGRRFSFESDFLQKNAGSLDFRAFVSDAYFIDIGIPEDYERAKREFATMFRRCPR